MLLWLVVFNLFRRKSENKGFNSSKSSHQVNTIVKSSDKCLAIASCRISSVYLRKILPLCSDLQVCDLTICIIDRVHPLNYFCNHLKGIQSQPRWRLWFPPKCRDKFISPHCRTTLMTIMWANTPHENVTIILQNHAHKCDSLFWRACWDVIFLTNIKFLW
jgi:hypothetical protein